MPVSDALTLFEHVDVLQTGRITLDELMDPAAGDLGSLALAPIRSECCQGLLTAHRMSENLYFGAKGTPYQPVPEYVSVLSFALT